jgi:DNA helicase-2/ATP-dependent DNA helicase PcrA
MLDLSTLNEEQRQAVMHMEGPCAVVANPGSGKTRVIVHRILYLLEQGVAPNRIWACTFTKKSANELKERLVKMYGEEAERINVTTLHSTSYAILKKFENNSHSRVKIVTMFDTWMFFDRIIKQNPKYRCKDIKRIIGFISYQKLELRRAVEVKEYLKEYLENEELNLLNCAEVCLYEYYRLYEIWLRENNFVDFSDMLMKTYFHLADPRKAPKVKQIVDRFDYLLVDEAQDANLASYKIYSILGSKFNNVMFCGDPKQSIYSFQGSSYDYLFDFVKKGAKLIELPLNYRSTQTIIEHSNKLIQRDPVFKDSTTITINETGNHVATFCTRDESDEANCIGEAVERLTREHGYAYKDIAVLYRVNAQAIPISDEFSMRGIPFSINVKNGFYKRAEIKKIVAYIKILIDPNWATVEDFMLIYNTPSRYIKSATMKLLNDSDYDSYWQSLTNCVDDLDDYRQMKNVKELINTVVEGTVACQDMTTEEIFTYVLNHCGFDSWLKNDDLTSDEGDGKGDDDRHMNVEVMKFACNHRPNPSEFVRYAEEQAGIVHHEAPSNSIKMMSMHASKGLEFPVVIIAGACDRIMPYHRAFNEGNEAEERRVAYVGVTRAQKQLIVSIIDGKYGRYNVKPSPYLHDMKLSVPSPSEGLNWSL